MTTVTDKSTPPVEPGDELPLENPEAFVAECLEALRSVKAVQSIAIGKTVTTRHPTWGEIWRADFDSDPSPDPKWPLVNRVVCWRHDDTVAVMLAIGQNVPPL